MATTVSPTNLDRTSSRRHHHHHQPSTTSSRSQSSRVKSSVPPPSPSRTSSSHHRANSRPKPADEILPQENYETSNVAQQQSRRSSRDESTRSGASTHRRSTHHSRYASDMATSTNGAGPAPVVTAQESRPAGKSGKSRTTIPASTGNWMLGKTIGAGSMGKVKLARRAEGGEQVNTTTAFHDIFSF
jgi:hypothetical protein